MRLLFGLFVLALAAPAAAQSGPRVAVIAESLFGDGTFLTEGYVPLLVTLESRVGRRLSGEVHVTLETYEGQIAYHRARVDLPAHATRHVVPTIFTDGRASHVAVSFEADGRTWGEVRESFDYSPGGRSMVVLGDPPRLRGALLDLDVHELLDGGPRQVRVPIGAVSFDPVSGDPMLPADGPGWSTVKVILASAPVLARIGARERRAIEAWLEAGGRLVVFPRTENDYAEPWLRELAGPIQVERLAAPAVAAPLEPAGGERFALSCRGEQRSESFGCSAPFGFGRVFVASYDATTPGAIESGAPRELARAVYAAPDDAAPMFAWARDSENQSANIYGTGFAVLRTALDPNEGFRPALVLVALVLLLYVVVVGPINFGWVQRKNRPVLALITTPIAALACLLVLLLVGYVGKGVEMRYRRFELIDVMEGRERAPSRRYTGLFATRPGSFDLPGIAGGGAAHRIEGRGADNGPTYLHEGARVRLSDFRAGLWETVFLREERMVPLGGAIRFERDDRRLATVVNDSALELESAFVIDAAGSVYRVGRIEAGGRAAIPRSPVGSVPTTYYDIASMADVLGDLLELPDDARPYVRGMLGLGAHRMVAGQLPTFYARVVVRPASIAQTFSAEADHQWIRVVPAMRGAAIVPAPEVVADPYASSASSYEEDVGPDGSPDAGAGDAGSPPEPEAAVPSPEAP